MFFKSNQCKANFSHQVMFYCRAGFCKRIRVRSSFLLMMAQKVLMPKVKENMTELPHKTTLTSALSYLLSLDGWQRQCRDSRPCWHVRDSSTWGQSRNIEHPLCCCNISIDSFFFFSFLPFYIQSRHV